VPEPTPLLEVRDLRVAFTGRGGEVAVVDRISFTLRAGEVLGVVGESGCGKSMTALALMRLLPPAARIAGGTVLLDGEDLTAATERRMCAVRGRRLAMIFQEPMSSLDPVQSIGTQVMEPVRVHFGLSGGEARRRALEVLDRVRIPAAASRFSAYPHELSGGLRQRVMIAIAISCDPQILLADEPTTALDVTIQAQVIELLRELQRASGMAVVIISHDLGVVGDFADRVAVMYAGRLVESGPVEALFARPLHPYTEALIASLPDPEGPRGTLSTIDGTVPLPAALPPGCRFAPRCGFARPVCATVLPGQWPASHDREAACLRPHDYAVPPHG
jgi:oligopeptide/dipeptide ABC transporter ATP-binding protein